MQRLAKPLFLAACLLLCAPPAATAAKRGTIHGRIVNSANGDPLANVRVVLTRSKPDGSQRVQQTERTNDKGAYAFTDLPTGYLYALDARYDGGLFAGGTVRLPDDTTTPPIIDTTLRVQETTSDPSAILIVRDTLFVVPNKEGVGIVESVRVVNQTTSAYIGRARELGGSKGRGSVTLGFPLPSPVLGQRPVLLDSDIDIPEIVPTDFGFATTVAIPPGETKFTFTYSLEGATSSFDLSRPTLYPVAQLSVFAARPLEIRSDRLEPSGEETIGGDHYRRWSTRRALDAGDLLQVIAVAQSSTSPALIAGIAVVLTAVAGLSAYSLRQRRGRGPPRKAGDEPAASRDALLVAIAQLDVRRERGDISHKEWTRRRARLKARLGRTEEQEPEPAS